MWRLYTGIDVHDNRATTTLDTAVPAGRQQSTRRWWVLATCCVIVFSRLIAPPVWAITPPTLLEAFRADSDLFRFYSGLSAVPQIVFLMAGGVLGDMYGRRRVLLLGLAGYCVFSLLCMLAPGLTALLAFRALSTYCAALAAPLALAMVRLTFNERELPLAILCYTGALSIAALLSPLLGFVLDQPFGWQAMFVVPIAAGGLGLLMALRYLSESKLDQQHRRIDTVACAAWATLSLVLLYAIIGFQNPAGWARQVALAALAVGLVACGLLVWYEVHARRTRQRRAAFRKRALSVVLIAGALMNMVLVGYFLQLWAYFGIARNYSAVMAVLALAPALPAIVLIIGLLKWVRRRWDARKLISGGLLVMAGAVGLTALGVNWAPYWWFVAPMMLMMMSYMVVATAWTTIFFLAVQRDFAGVNAAINTSAGLIGSVLGGTLPATLMVVFGQAAYARRLAEAGVPQPIAERAIVMLNFALRLDSSTLQDWSRALLEQVLVVYRESYAVAFAQVLGLLALLCLAGAVTVWFGLRQRDTT